MTQPDLPALMTGRQTPGDPLAAAIRAARQGVDAGLICWRIDDGDGRALRAALVLVPDDGDPAPARALPACAVALRDAMGVLIPSEVGITFDWSGTVRANGGRCGRIGLHAPDDGAWLIVLLDLTFALPDGPEPGHRPQDTALDQEGCASLSPVDLLSAWARHSLFHLHNLDDPRGGVELARNWHGLIHDIASGQALGLDQDMALIRPGKAPLALTTLINRV